MRGTPEPRGEPHAIGLHIDGLGGGEHDALGGVGGAHDAPPRVEELLLGDPGEKTDQGLGGEGGWGWPGCRVARGKIIFFGVNFGPNDEYRVSNDLTPNTD